jgi:hypothetical protein
MVERAGHTSGGEDHSLWSHYSEEIEEGSRERKLGPALRIVLIRFPNPRSHCPMRIIHKFEIFGHTVNTLNLRKGILASVGARRRRIPNGDVEAARLKKQAAATNAKSESVPPPSSRGG